MTYREEQIGDCRLILGDCREVLRSLPDNSVNCCVTSPPYFGLRDYGTASWDGGDPDCDHRAPGERRQIPHGDGRQNDSYADERVLLPGVGATYQGTCKKCRARRIDLQIGLEPSPDDFVAELVAVFREVRRVLRDDGTLWLNLGDSYTGSGKGGNPDGGAKQSTNKGSQSVGSLYGTGKTAREAAVTNVTRKVFDLGPKQLLGIPWRVAFALQADGWYLRQDIVWSKPNPMPESVKDRCTRSHEYIFMLTKSPRYFYDAAAIAERAIYAGITGQDETGFKDAKQYNGKHSDKQRGHGRRHAGFNDRWDAMSKAEQCSGTRNKRSVWNVATKPFSGAHFATFPPDLIEPCILAGCPIGGTVLDPFNGAATTGVVAAKHGRKYVGIELNPDYLALSIERLTQATEQPDMLFAVEIGAQQSPLIGDAA